MDWFIREDMGVGGEATKAAEGLVAQYVGTAHATLTTTGTQALSLAIQAVLPRRRCNVVVPAWAPVAVWNAVRLSGHRPIFVDIDPKTLGYDTTKLDEASQEEPDAIVFVHMLGRREGLVDAAAFAVGHGIPLIEDMAQAHLQGPLLFGDIGITSFGSMKPISCDQGGAMFTNNHRVECLMTELAHQGFGYKDGFLVTCGQNARMNEGTAEMLIAELLSVDDVLAPWRERQAQAIPEELLVFPGSMYNVIRATDDDSYLLDAGIPFRRQYRPANYHCAFPDAQGKTYEGAEYAWRNYLFLPFGPDMTEQDAAKIREALT